MSGPDSTLLTLEEVTVRFGLLTALDRVSLQIHPGETCVVLGAAGSGKTTLLKVAMGLVKPNEGKAYLFGQDITNLKERELFDLRARVGILFQEGGLFDSLTIAENVAYPLLNQRVLKDAAAVSGNGARSGNRSIDERVREALHFVELEQTLEKFPSELSGGMRRRVGIARAIVTAPALVLYDSPTAGLDPITANTIIALIMKERDLRNTATIMVTHRYQDGHLMANFRYNPSSGGIERAVESRKTAGGQGTPGPVSTRYLVMKEGRLVFEGTEPDLLASQDSYVQKFARPGAA